MILLLGLLCSIWAEPAQGLEEDGGFSFEGDLRQLTVSNNFVYIATKEKLYQLSHDLVLIHSLTQRGILKNPHQEISQEFYRVSMDGVWNQTFNVNVFLPFVNNDTLISCGATDHNCGYCEVLDLKNISKVLHKEPVQVGPRRSISGSVSFLVDVKNSEKTETYILTAIENDRKIDEDRCPSDLGTINLHNTNSNQSGDIFNIGGSISPPRITADGDVGFVDGFQINSTVYLFSNVASGNKPNKVRLIWLQAETSKSETLRSLHGATLRTSDGGEGSKLLASSVIPGGQQVLWSGVFSLDVGQTNTELLLFDISPNRNSMTYNDPDFFYKPKKPVMQSEPVALKPKDLRFKKNHMSSVLALRLNGWIVFFIGTADGQLIKLAVDKNYRPTCPKILYKTSGDNRVLPNIRLDPVDHKHVYIPFKNQVQRVPVAKCSTYQNMKDCLSAQDPHCIWCVTQASCTFKDDCKDAEWLSIPDHSNQKIISHRVMEDSPGNLKIVIQTHLTMEHKVRSNFACQFSASSTPPCKEQGPQPQYPQCTCTLKDPFPTDGLDITINIILGKTFLKEQIKMINCSDIHGQPSVHLCQQCIRAGCGWRENSCSWATDPAQNDSICSGIGSGMNYSEPNISSINPRVVSVYGRNNALLTGLNLRNVTRVRTQADMDCDPKESPVWNNNGSHLMFHIPPSEIKRTITVCAVLPDGSCHGSFPVTYRSSPSCMDIVPRSSWRSGNRIVTLIGTHLNFVEKVTHSNAPHMVILPRNSNYKTLIYETPAVYNYGISSSTVFLKIANQTLTCSTKMTYYPDPEFTSFTAVRAAQKMQIFIQKKADKLNMTPEELFVWGIHDGKQYPCIIKSKETSEDIEIFRCEVQSLQNADLAQIQISYGEATIKLQILSSLHKVLLLLRLLLIPFIIAALVAVCLIGKRGLAAETIQLLITLCFLQVQCQWHFRYF